MAAAGRDSASEVRLSSFKDCLGLRTLPPPAPDAPKRSSP